MAIMIFSPVSNSSNHPLFDEILKLEISKYYVIFVYFQAAVSALLAVSVLYVEKKIKIKYYVIFRDFELGDFVK